MKLNKTTEPLLSAVFKQQADDFCVDEELGFDCTGHGEHVWVLIKKTGINTQEAAQRLARAAGIASARVYWSGLKDRQGVCRQWLSLHMPGRTVPASISAAESEHLVIENIQRNNRKLRRGSHRANRFVIRLRKLQHLSGATDTDASLAALDRRLTQISRQGVPNYFGEQRFGFDNINKARDWFAGKYRPRNHVERGLLLSSARSLIFNAVLSERVSQSSWNRFLTGDVVNLDGSASVFVPDGIDDALRARLREGDVHPTGPMWGRGDMRTSAECRELEEVVASRFPDLVAGLVTQHVEASRRSLRLPVQALHYRLLKNTAEAGDLHAATAPDLELSFVLPAGTYATAVLHDLIEYNSP